MGARFDSTRRAGLWLGAMGWLLASAACTFGRPPTTSLRLEPAVSSPGAARVVIDDMPVGSLAFVTKRGVAMPPGRHRITIEARGYLPWDGEVDAGPHGGLVRLPVTLVRVPD